MCPAHLPASACSATLVLRAIRTAAAAAAVSMRDSASATSNVQKIAETFATYLHGLLFT
jgi:hypothetical protein